MEAIMAKRKKKNSNYVTEKRTAAKLEAERKAKKQRIIKTTVAIAVPLLIITAIVLTLIFVGGHFGWWSKAPVVTDHAEITVEGYGTMHVELYGESAPMAVQTFLALVGKGEYDKIHFDKLVDGKLETTAISGVPFAESEVKNPAKHKKGSLVMMFIGDTATANGEFYITTEKNKDLDGKGIVFGRIDAESMELLDKIIAGVELGENGIIQAWARPRITKISVHASH